jgi:hypothetical protein
MMMGTVTKIRGNEPQTVEEWQNYIAEGPQGEVESVIETGRRLLLAKEKTDPGKWLKIFEGKNKPFSEDTAQRRMAISRNSVLTNTAHVRYLPSAWSTLYELTKIPEPILLQMIQDGRIHPGLRRSEAEVLLPDEKEHEEKIQGFIAIFEGNCYQAMSLAPCDCSYLKGRVTKGLIDLHKKVIETWTHATDNLIAQGMEEEEV